MSATPQQTAIHDLVAGDEPLTIEKFAGKSDPSAADVLAMAEKLGVRMVDLKFTDVPGTWQHMTLSVSAWRRTRSATASASTAPRSAASSRSPSRTCC